MCQGSAGDQLLARSHAARAELRAARSAKLGEGLVERQGLAVHPIRDHRVERISDMKNARADGDFLAAQPVG